MPRRCLLLLLLFVCSLQAAELARWSANQSANSEGIAPVKGPDASWSMQTVAGIRVAAVTPVKDYYRRASTLLRVDKPVHHSMWLQIGYLDRGYGQITVSHGTNGSKSVAPRAQWAVARLNRGKLRHAVFRIGQPVFDHGLDPRLNPGADIRIEGVAQLQQVMLSDTEPAPEHCPMSKLQWR